MLYLPTTAKPLKYTKKKHFKLGNLHVDTTVYTFNHTLDVFKVTKKATEFIYEVRVPVM